MTSKGKTLYLVIAALGVLIGMYGHWEAIKYHQEVMSDKDTIHTQAATIVGLHDVNGTLKNSVWYNTPKIDELIKRVDSLEKYFHERHVQ